MAGELGETCADQLGVVAIAPALDLGSCADALERRENFIYQNHFVKRLKRHMRYKASLYPEMYPIDKMKSFAEVKTVRGFDDAITARFCGFRSADDYYETCSALRVVSGIRRPTLIITSKNDPFVPYEPFEDPAIRENPFITCIATDHGGHCAFISSSAATSVSGLKPVWSNSAKANRSSPPILNFSGYFTAQSHGNGHCA